MRTIIIIESNSFRERATTCRSTCRHSWVRMPTFATSAACNAILDRGWGKAREPRELPRPSNVRDMTDEQLLDIILAGRAQPLPSFPHLERRRRLSTR